MSKPSRQQRIKPYGHEGRQERHYLQSCVRPDVWSAIRKLCDEHNLSISGAAHHLMRLGAGLKPLYPFNTDSSHD
jgi:hypothetical protein